MYEKLEALPWVYCEEMTWEDPLFELLHEYTTCMHRYAWLDENHIIVNETVRIDHTTADIEYDSYYQIVRVLKLHGLYCSWTAILGDIDTFDIEGIEYTTADELFVEEEYRRRGYATEIMKHAMNLFDIDSLKVSTWNDAAINCYRKLGFLYPGDEGYPSIPKVEGVPEFTGILPNSKLAIMLRKDKCN